MLQTLLLTMLLLTFAVTANAQTLVFGSGGEVGTLTEFGAAPGASLIFSPVRTGNYAIRLAPTSSGTAYVQLPQSLLYSNRGHRFGLYIETLPSASEEIFYSESTVGVVGVSLRLNPNGTLSLFNNNSLAADGITALAVGQWYTIQLFTKNQGLAGAYGVKINGAEEFAANQVFIQTSGNLTYFGKANNRNNGSYSVVIDDLRSEAQIISDYPADGHIIARQGTSTAPTDNAFTKSPTLPIDGVWSDTPPNISTNASSSGSGAAQTMRFASSSLTGTLNEAWLVMSAHRESGPDCAVSFRRRVNGGAPIDTDAQVLTTTEQFYISSGFTDTFANLDMTEGGVVRGSCKKQKTVVSDMWLMIDYLP